jgi:hypothetical protein
MYSKKSLKAARDDGTNSAGSAISSAARTCSAR